MNNKTQSLHTFPLVRNVFPYLVESLWEFFIYILFFATHRKIYGNDEILCTCNSALISSHPWGLTSGNSRVFAPRHLEPIFFHKKVPPPLPREHNLKGLPNSNIISCIIFNKSSTIIYTVSKNSESACFLVAA